MNCPKCGTVIGDDSQFCANCGAKIKAGDTKGGAKKAVAQTAKAEKGEYPPLDFGAILSRAFKLPWQYRSLWFFGVLYAIFAGGSSYNSSYQTNNNSPIGNPFPQLADKFGVSTLIVWGVILFLIAIAFMVLSAIVGSWSLAAIIKGTKQIEDGKSTSRKEIGKTGKGPVWNLIKLNILLPLGIVLGFIIVCVPIAILLGLAGPAGIAIGAILVLLLILALIPISIYLGVVWMAATRFVVLEGKKTFESLKAGRAIIKGRFWMTFLYSAVSGLISGVGGCLGSILLIIFVAATVGLVIAGIYIGAIITGILALFGLIVLMVVAGYFAAFTQSGLTLWWLGLKKLRSGK